MWTRVVLPLALSAFLSIPGLGQQSSPIIDFSEAGIPLPDFGHVRLGYPVCGEDGNLFLNMMIDPGQSQDSHLVSVAPTGKVVIFDFRKIPGLRPGSHLISFAVRSDEVTLLVGALPDNSASSVGFDKQADQFLLQYSLAGTLQAVHGLPPQLRINRIVYNAGGRLVALAYNKTTAHPVLVSMSSNGTELEDIPLSEVLITPEEAKAYFSKHSLPGMEDIPVADQIASSLNEFQLFRVKDDVLLLKPGSVSRIYRVTPSGLVQAMSVKVPSGEVRSIFPTVGSDLTLIAFGDNARIPTLFQLDNTGTYKRQLILGGISPAAAICNQASKYYAVRFNQGQAMLVSGELLNQQSQK